MGLTGTEPCVSANRVVGDNLQRSRVSQGGAIRAARSLPAGSGAPPWATVPRVMPFPALLFPSSETLSSQPFCVKWVLALWAIEICFLAPLTQAFFWVLWLSHSQADFSLQSPGTEVPSPICCVLGLQQIVDSDNWLLPRPSCVWGCSFTFFSTQAQTGNVAFEHSRPSQAAAAQEPRLRPNWYPGISQPASAASSCPLGSF